MKISIAGDVWESGNLGELERLKEKIAGFLKEQAAKRYKIDRQLENEAAKWFKESRFPGSFLKKAENAAIVIEQDETGFPFEMLMAEGAFLGQKYRICRKTLSPVHANPNFKICYQFEENDEAYPYYEYIEETFPLELLEPVTGNISANVFHVSGHFEKEDKEKILSLPLEKNVLLFFNSCRTFAYKNREMLNGLSHFVLTYFDIPLENPQAVEDFPYFFYRCLLEGEDIGTAFLAARQKYIEQTGCLTPLLFTLFTPDPGSRIFNTPYAAHHQEIEKQVKGVEKEVRPLKDYPLFLFRRRQEGSETLQSLLNSPGDNIWIHGEKAGIGKTTLLYQVFQLFKYGKFKGPFFFSFREDRGLRELRLKGVKEYLGHYLKIGGAAKALARNGKKYLILVDGIESNACLYDEFGLFVEELKDIFGACRVVVASRRRCPAAGFEALDMEILPGDVNAGRLRACYQIESNIKLPELPLVYRLFSQARESCGDQGEMDKSRVFSAFIRHYQAKIFEERALEAGPAAFQRYLAILAYLRFKSGEVTKGQFLEGLRFFQQDHEQETDWWVYDKERRSYRDAESIGEFLLSTHIIVNKKDFLEFIHDSFYEYLLAYYFSWQGMEEEDEAETVGLMYGEVPDYMRERVKTGVYAGDYGAAYLGLVLDRLFYVRDYKGIEAILAKPANHVFIKTSDQLWYCLVKGCYYARNPEKEMDEVRAFQMVQEFARPGSLFDPEKLNGTAGRSLRETCFALLNILFDNNLLEEFFRLAFFLKEVSPSLETHGLLSRGYLKVRQIEQSLAYWQLKEQEIQSQPGKEREKVRLQAERGLIYYYQYVESGDRGDFDKGIAQLSRAEDYYRGDKREEWNYLFTLREFLRFYLAAGEPGEFAGVMRRIRQTGIDDHPKTDYIPYLQGRQAIESEGEVEVGINHLVKGAEGFYEKQLFFESAVVYLWAYYYSQGPGKEKHLRAARDVFARAADKRNQIKNHWDLYDRYLKEMNPPNLPGFSNPFDRLRNFFREVDNGVDLCQLRELLQQVILIA